jgi:hypothetical protein
VNQSRANGLGNRGPEKKCGHKIENAAHNTASLGDLVFKCSSVLRFPRHWRRLLLCP